MPEHLLTSTQLAERVGVHQQTIARWAREGKIPCVRTPGGRLRFDAERVVAALGATQVEATA